MSFPAIATHADSTLTGSSGTLNIPARSAGDIILLLSPIWGGSGAKDHTLGALNGVSWSLLGSVAGITSATEYLIAYYLRAGSSGSATTVSVSVGGSWNLDAATVLDITGAHSTTAPEGSFTTGLDPGSLNPSGWGTEDTLWIAACARFNTAPTGGPSGYTNSLSTTVLRVDYKTVNAASEDPGTFTGGTGNGSVATLAIRPIAAAVVTPPKVNLYRQMRRRSA